MIKLNKQTGQIDRVLADNGNGDQKIFYIGHIEFTTDDNIIVYKNDIGIHKVEANIKIIPVINKIDIPESNIDKVRNEMIANEIVPDDLGGDCLFVNVSAKTGGLKKKLSCLPFRKIPTTAKYSHK